jgi:non-canonical poly(A) RNA polymerase PAPD5/7
MVRHLRVYDPRALLTVFRLHNEILDFYDFVAPEDYEHDARSLLVQRVQDALSSTNWLGVPGSILCFGSFPAGLYLPTADMDLVYASDQHVRGGPQAVDTSRRGALKSVLYRASKRLSQAKLVKGSAEVIWAAKVPIIKFKDRVTNIDVDISFENLSGVQAQATFDQWKRQHPDMTYMVALLKQFLAMRGLNEVHKGGIGGFTIICLVVSYIHHTQKSSNLGQCFVGFLEYYGKQFNLATQRIQMHPPAVVWKTGFDIDGRPEKQDGLSIQDPNRPENNISGGSHNVSLIFQAFAQAHDTITDRMRGTSMGEDIGDSILECILGGNYTQYQEQRSLLRSLAT